MCFVTYLSILFCLQTVFPLPTTRPQVKEKLLRQSDIEIPATKTTAKKDEIEKGYDYDFVKPPPEGLLCKICNLPARHPVQASCCGGTFCRKCVSNYQSSACPNTECKEENFEFVNDKRAVREINDLQVYCTNKILGCSWIGDLSSLENHLNVGASTSTGCQYTQISCSNNCGVVMLRSLLEEHLKSECELRQEKCEYCGHVDKYQWIRGGHQLECPRYPIECPNHCDVGYVRRDIMDAHLEVCPLAIVKCPFAIVGCDSVVRRKDLTEHIESATTQHVENMVRAIFSTITRLHSAREHFEQRIQELRVHFDYINVTNQSDMESAKRSLSVATNEIERAKEMLSIDNKRLQVLLAEAQSLRQRAIDVENKLAHNYEPVLDDLKYQLEKINEELQFEIHKVNDEVTKELQDARLSVQHTNKSLRMEMDTFRDELSVTKESIKNELATATGDINKLLTSEKTSLDNVNSQLQESMKELETCKGEVEMLKQKSRIEAQQYRDGLKVTEEELFETKKKLKQGQDRFDALFNLLDWSIQLKFLHATSSDTLPDVYLEMTEFTKYKSTKEVWYSPPFYTGDKGYKMCLSVSLHTAGYVSIYVLLMSGENDKYLCWPIKGTLKLQLLNQLGDDSHTPPVNIVFDGSDDSCHQVIAGERARFGNYYGKFIPLKHLNNDVKRKVHYCKEDTLYFRLLTFVMPEI